MGFFTFKVEETGVVELGSQSLSGWDGVFHRQSQNYPGGHKRLSRNPFQGGMGFFTCRVGRDGCGATSVVAIPFRVGWGFSRLKVREVDRRLWMSQSLSGWDGIFHLSFFIEKVWVIRFKSQSLSGWDGVFHMTSSSRNLELFRSRNPFQGGMGFFTGWSKCI